MINRYALIKSDLRFVFLYLFTKNVYCPIFLDHFVNDQPKVFNVPMSEYVGQDTVSEKLDAGVSNTEGIF